MYYVGTAVVFFIAGWVVSYFVVRNNPKYLNLDKMAKDKLQALADKIKDKL